MVVQRVHRQTTLADRWGEIGCRIIVFGAPQAIQRAIIIHIMITSLAERAGFPLLRSVADALVGNRKTMGDGLKIDIVCHLHLAKRRHRAQGQLEADRLESLGAPVAPVVAARRHRAAVFVEIKDRYKLAVFFVQRALLAALHPAGGVVCILSRDMRRAECADTEQYWYL